MSNQPYDVARFRMLTANLDWPNLNLVLSLWSGTPAFVATHQLISHIKGAGGNELGVSLPVTLTSVPASGYAVTNNIVVPEVPIGPSVTWMTMSERVSPHDNSKLLLFIDEALDLPFVSNGLDIVITPDWLNQRGWFRP